GCPGSKSERGRGASSRPRGAWTLPQCDAACSDVPCLIDFDWPYEYEPCTNRPFENGRRASYAMFHEDPLSVFSSRTTSLSVVTLRVKNGRPPTPVAPDTGTKFRFWYLMSFTVFDQTKS